MWLVDVLERFWAEVEVSVHVKNPPIRIAWYFLRISCKVSEKSPLYNDFVGASKHSI